MIDGDTVEVTLPGSSRVLKVRLLDCWAPERFTPKGDLATAYAEDTVEEASETHLWIPAPEDTHDILGSLLTFGRILGHLFISETETLSERMVKTGHATRNKR